MTGAAVTGITVLTVFAQGLLSFFSPCVLPLVPLYLGYLSGGGAVTRPDGTVRYRRGRILLNTACFTLGISFAFSCWGWGSPPLAGSSPATSACFPSLPGCSSSCSGFTRPAASVWGR